MNTESEASCGRDLSHAAGSWILALAVMQGAHFVTAAFTVPYEINPTSDYIVGGILGVASIVFLAWLGARVRQGRRLLLAICVLLFFNLSAVVGVAFALLVAYYGTPLLVAVQILTILVLLRATWSTLRAIRMASDS